MKQITLPVTFPKPKHFAFVFTHLASFNHEGKEGSIAVSDKIVVRWNKKEAYLSLEDIATAMVAILEEQE